MESIEAVNKALFLQINAGSDTPAWLIDWATFIAEDLIYLIPTFLVVLWLWGDERWRNLALKVCAVTLFALGLRAARPFCAAAGLAGHTRGGQRPSGGGVARLGRQPLGAHRPGP